MTWQVLTQHLYLFGKNMSFHSSKYRLYTRRVQISLDYKEMHVRVHIPLDLSRGLKFGGLNKRISHYLESHDLSISLIPCLS